MNRCSGYEAKDVCTWPPSLVRSRRLPPLQQSSSPYVRRTCLHTLDYKICSISAVILAVIGGQKHPLTLSHLPLDKFKLLKYKFINTWLQIPTKKQKTNFPKYEEWTCIVLIYRYQYFYYKHCQRHNGPEGWVHLAKVIMQVQTQILIEFHLQNLPKLMYFPTGAIKKRKGKFVVHTKSK